jgi:hypothetical protein
LDTVVAEPPLPPLVEVTDTQTPATSVPPAAAVTVPEMVAPGTIAALTPVAGDATVGATATAPVTAGVLLYHWDA